MKKILLLLTFFIMVNMCSYAQYNSFLVNYGGNAKAIIEGDDNTITVAIPSGTTLQSSTISVYHPSLYYSTEQNKQVINSIQVWCSSNVFDQNIKYDSFGNAYSELNQNQKNWYLAGSNIFKLRLFYRFMTP